ncbi:preprotein translocase subunit SecE [Alkalilimnicola ehrlichii MLHE-1]|uniref:Protein translocase subunit SecE n=1 Tax=Alkalilimnicola ehrlichii (strain ATCC BAA-1101 / DSM 17681 / MLHE-1) TaxID=187272 RepID=Q0ABI8_ALKEH|nr:preprotein translocase subunit SecE [Alkalilimnicola ehrlichii]ABI55799.1 protein translocase subunit secE/sec61 gamma [Alkalilimnicola ehrlichii MLHE-1]
MKSSVESQSSGLDKAKIVVAIALVLGAIAGFHYYGDEPLLFRVLGLLAVVAAAGGVMMTTAAGQAVWQFARASRQELRKVVWPNRQETLQTTLIVFVMVVLVALFLWLVDLLAGWGIGRIIGLGV